MFYKQNFQQIAVWTNHMQNIWGVLGKEDVVKKRLPKRIVGNNIN